MAKTKKVKAKTAKKRIVKEARAISQASRTLSRVKEMPSRFWRRRILVKNLILFGALFVLSFVIERTSSDEAVQQSFSILAILTGFLAVALLIALLVLLFLGRKGN